MNIGQKIKALIEQRRLNKADFARQLDMSEQNLYKIFKKRSVDAELLVQMAKLLQVRASSFFEEEPVVYRQNTPHAQVDDPIAEYRISKQALEDIPTDALIYIRHLEQEVNHLRELNLLKDELIGALKRG